MTETTPDWRTAIRFAAEGGHLHVFEWMATDREDKRGPWNGDFQNSLEIAAGSGHLALVQWLYERGSDTLIWTHPLEYTREYAENVWKYYYDIPSAMGNAAANGHLAVVQWLYGVTNWVHADAIKRAISRGHVDLVKWIYEVKGDRPCIIVLSKCVGEAAENGHLRMLKWLGLEGILDRVTISIDGAARNGHLEVIQWCLETDLAECSSYTLDLAVTHGHLEVAKWLHDKVPDNSAWAFSGSAADEAESEHLDGLQRRLCAQYLGTRHGMDEAAKDGHVDVVAWLHKCKHARGTLCTVVSAVHKGHLHVVQWLHEHYSDKFSSFVMDEAATQGQLEIVQWLHENRTEGCTTTAMDQAALHGHFDVVLWLISHRTEGFSSAVTGEPRHFETFILNEDTFSTLVESCTHGQKENDQLRAVQAAFKLRPEFVQNCLQYLTEVALSRSFLAILDWMKRFGLKLRSTARIRRAVSGRNLSLVKWFYQNGFEICEPRLAVDYGRLTVAFWLSERGYKMDLSKLLLMATERMLSSGNVTPIIRRLIEKGVPFSLRMVRNFILSPSCVELARWLCESDRLELLLSILKNGNEIYVWWLLTHTRFELATSKIKIRGAIQETTSQMRKWLRATVDDPEVIQLCFSGKRTAMNDAVESEPLLPPTKRLREQKMTAPTRRVH